MAKEAAESVSTQELVDAFTWDESGDGIFTAPEPVETKAQKEKKVLKEVKDDNQEEEDGNGGDSEYEPFSEIKHEEPEGKGSENTEGKGDKGKTSKTTGAASTKDDGAVDKPTGKTGDESSDTSETFFKTLAQEMVDKKIFSAIEIAEDDIIDEDKFFELQEAEVQARADEIFEDVFEQLNNDPDAVAFLKHKKAGGSTYDFFNVYRDNSTLPDNLDLTKEANQEKVIKYYLLNIQKVDEEDIAETLEVLKEKGKYEVQSKKYYKMINDAEVATKLDLATKQENSNKISADNAVKLRTNLQKILEAGVGEGNFKFTKEETKELIPYITKPSVKIGTNRFITDFQAEIGVIMKDPKKMLTLAKIIRKKFDVPELTKATTTTVVNQVKSKLMEAKSNNKTRSTQTDGEKSLADMFSS